MIVCSCNGISCRDLADAVDEMMVEDPGRLITPAQVYRSLDKRPRCGGCLPHAAELVHQRAACLRGCQRCTCKRAHGGPRDRRVANPAPVDRDRTARL